MENARVKAAAEAAAQLYEQGADESAMLLRGAVMSLYLGGRITRDELGAERLRHFLRAFSQPEDHLIGKRPRYLERSRTGHNALFSLLLFVQPAACYLGAEE